jgi:hypothetical protein
MSIPGIFDADPSSCKIRNRASGIRIQESGVAGVQEEEAGGADE